jgi:hypothetical protein
LRPYGAARRHLRDRRTAWCRARHSPARAGRDGLFNVQEICARTRALGRRGKATISHGFCLGNITERKAVAAAETMAETGVAHGAGSLTLPPVEMLRAAGVLVFAGNDDIRDTWSPYGTGDLLERAPRSSGGKAISAATTKSRPRSI